ncbi:amidohydrolase [Pleomorphovibrio marinus]|uniref:amidohydrolase n=1 Tax=Pleomorphovibrio marinus TaxID=2164132 RepID=UPI000E0B840A|nr:amidohydrolase [Pleomorphovibrio marinus]
MESKKEDSTLAQFRKELHQYPELSGEEKETAKRVRSFLEAYEPDEWIDGLGKHGFAVSYIGKKEGPSVMFRAELDALPIFEKGSHKHKSTNEGVSHACGHDGHMAILCGLAMKLAQERPERGKVTLLFQPSEETGEGAESVINSTNFKKISPEYSFALHNVPGYPLHQVILKKGPFNAASKGMIIQLEGRTSHAAHPEEGNSPGEAMSKLIVGLPQLSSGISDFSLITVIHAILGEVAFGTTPGEAKVMATLRTFDDQSMDTLTHHAENLTSLIAKEYGLKYNISYCEVFQTVENDPKAWEFVNEAAKQLKLKTKHVRIPFYWSEDFGQFSKVTQSMLFGLGSGKAQSKLHDGAYDFPDELLPTGSKLFMEVTKKLNF